MAGNLIPGDNDVFTFSGRCDFSNKNEVAFDWPGIIISFGFTGTSCMAIIGGPCMFDLFIDNQFVKTISAADKKDTLLLADNLTNKKHIVKLVKRNETLNKPVVFYGVIADHNTKPFNVAQKKIPGKIEFIGDSYTAGYANEFPFRECEDEDSDSIVFSTTNTGKSFGSLIADAFNAERYINAISGKGIVRNYGWADKGMEFFTCYERTLLTSINNPAVNGVHWNYTWHPDVIVIGLGINDFQADPPYADPLQFDSTYKAFISLLKEKHPGVKIICCATKIWPANTLISRVRGIVESFREKGDNSLFYFEYETENTALYGHPSIRDHQKIAHELGALIGAVTGWKSKNKISCLPC
jgi:lysophospholipase L1-like esterase